MPTSSDYSLTSERGKQAIERGLYQGNWYKSPVPREVMKGLMKRSDGPALRDTALWFAILIVCGAAGAFLWGTWWAVPFFIVYGVFYGSSGDSRWHECGHGTAFKTRWMNAVVYYIASFMIFRDPTVWRWSHTRHHTDTYIVGLDPEIVGVRPPQLIKMVGYFTGLADVPFLIRDMLRHAAGSLSADEKTFVPEMERHKVYFTARIWVLIYVAVIAACFFTSSILPAMLIGLPRFYGVWLVVWLAIPQHVGLSDDVLDHRLNCRTVYMNPVFRFIYWNMNYHVEHHMFPMVPYYALPRLHEAIKADCPPAYKNVLEAYREIVPTLFKQLEDPDYHIVRPLPKPASATTPVPVVS
jgi:fatty acid desaturase